MTLLYTVITVLQAATFLMALRLLLRRPNWYGLLAALTIGALIYDNAIIAAGASIGAGDALKALNALRFYGHALLTPTLIIFAFGVARRAGLPWAQSRRNHALFCTLATALILYGAYFNIVTLSLEVDASDGLVRYVNAAPHGPPLASIITIIVVAIVGVLVWRSGKSWGLALGSAFMFVTAMLGVSVPVVANVGEVAMTNALVDGERTAQQPLSHAPSYPPSTSAAAG